MPTGQGPGMDRYKAERGYDQAARQAAFLEALALTGIINEACKEAGIHRSTYYWWMEQDEEFTLKANQAREVAIEEMEAEAKRRAMVGVEKPVYQGGVEVGRIREYSDTLLMFMLKAAKPEKYRDRFVVGGEGSAVKVYASEAWEAV